MIYNGLRDSLFKYSFIYLIFKSLPNHAFIDFLKRERGGERERHRSDVSCMRSDQTGNLSKCPDLEPVNFWCVGQCSNQPNHTGQSKGSLTLLLCLLLIYIY